MSFFSRGGDRGCCGAFADVVLGRATWIGRGGDRGPWRRSPNHGKMAKTRRRYDPWTKTTSSCSKPTDWDPTLMPYERSNKNSKKKHNASTICAVRGKERRRKKTTKAMGGWERRTTRQKDRNEGRQEKKPPSDTIETETKHRRCVPRRSNHVAQADETHDRTRRNEQESRNPTRDSQHQANGTWSRTNKPCKKNNRCRCANGRSPKTDGNASKRSKCRANDERNHRTWKRNADDIHPTTTTTDAGREMHEDHRRQHGRSQVRHQRQTDRQGTCCRLRNE